MQGRQRQGRRSTSTDEGIQQDSKSTAPRRLGFHRRACQRQCLRMVCPVAQDRPGQQTGGRHARAEDTSYTVERDLPEGIPVRATFHESDFAKDRAGLRDARRRYLHGTPHTERMVLCI